MLESESLNFITKKEQWAETVHQVWQGREIIIFLELLVFEENENEIQDL